MRRRVRAQRVLALAALLLSPVAGAENLLKNPGFEAIKVGVPVGWDVFVMPQEGAQGRIDDRSVLDGKYSAMLHNPAPYAREPANNWSQNIIADLAGKELMVLGNIKTQEATEAALWLQCWSKRPWGVLHAATTSTDSPVSGTRDWTPVKMNVTVPKGTDYVTLRCVLKGRGTAWFDSLEVAEQRCESGAEDEDKHEEDAKTEEEPPWTEADVTQTLLEAHKAMVQTNRVLRDTNEALTTQIEILQQELAALRAQLVRVRLNAITATELAELEPLPNEGCGVRGPGTSGPGNAVRVPPLVPHGYNLEELR